MINTKEKKNPQHNSQTSKFFDVKKLYLPLSQHTGKPSCACVEPGREVKEAELLAKSDGLISAYLSAPKRGKVASIVDFNHPVLTKSPAVILNCLEGSKDYTRQKGAGSFSKKELLEIITRSGIVGMGGACFPTHVKLSPPKEVDTLIINGCECEPYLSCDYRLMLENTEGIFSGAGILGKILSVKQVIFAIEDNKPEAIKKFNLLVNTKKSDFPNFKIAILKSIYPQGSEKQLIYKLTKRKVPSGGFPFDVNCMVQNVGTAFAVYEAIYFNKPLIERIVTFAGGALKKPKNLWVKIGTGIKELFDAGILEFKQDPVKVIYGGPMMGIALDSLEYSILKGTSGILFLTKEEAALDEESNCIRCARCVDACPMELIPSEYVKKVKRNEFDLGSLYLNDCIECGCCTYVCPAKIPIVQYIRTGKKYAIDN